jgi:hypothetical protein
MADETVSKPLGGSMAEWIGRASATTLVCLALLGYFGGFWVSGSQYREAKADAVEWKKLAIEGLKTAEDAKKVRMGMPIEENTTIDVLAERLKMVKEIEP